MAKKATTAPGEGATEELAGIPAEVDHDAAVAAFGHYLFRGGDASPDAIRDAAEKAIEAGAIFHQVANGRVA